MRANVSYEGLRDLESDLRKIGPMFYREGAKVIRENVSEGGKTARRIAKWTSGTHARLYPTTITWDRSLGVGAAFGALRAEYGPEHRGQGMLAPILENGSINNPPHNNLLQAMDLGRPKLYRDVDHLLDRLFWPES